MLEKGDSGVSVIILQQNLEQLGVAKLSSDGVYGDDTFHAVEMFQSAHSIPITGIVDELTDYTIAKAIAAQMSTAKSPWLEWMRDHIGEIEETGSKATDFDNEVFSHTSYGNLDGIMEPGCAATACAALEETGFKSTHSAAAESFRNFGEPSALVPGAIVGFNWKGKKGVHADHVAFCDHVIDQNLVACLGGNQHSQVKVSIFSRAFIDFIRFPVAPIDAV